MIQGLIPDHSMAPLSQLGDEDRQWLGARIPGRFHLLLLLDQQGPRPTVCTEYCTSDLILGRPRSIDQLYTSSNNATLVWQDGD